MQGPIWRFVSKVGMFHFGRGLLVRFNLVYWKTHFSMLQGLFECFNIFFRFSWFSLQTFDVFQLPRPKWGFLSDAGMFHFGRGLLVRFNLVYWKTHFSMLQGFFECFNVFFRFSWFSLQTFDVFQLPRPKWGFLGDSGMFDFGWGLLVRFNLVYWKTHFSILQGLFECFNIFFRFCWFLLQTFDVFQLLGPKWGFLSDVGMFYFGRGLLVYFSLVDWKTHFSILQGLLKCFNIFFKILLVFVS